MSTCMDTKGVILMSKIHNLKLLTTFCDDVYNGIKTFEIRENDRGYQTGDYIIFTPYNGSEHPIKKCKFRITYILNGWGLKNGYVVLGISNVTGKEDEQ